MKHIDQVEVFRAEALQELEKCPKCQGRSLGCDCIARCEMRSRAYEACIPRDFWEYTTKDVEWNTDAFESVVRPYIRKLPTALKNGYGLLFLGDNGSGKTMFTTLVLMAACRRGYTAYYTTMSQLTYDIKRGFDEPAARKRLEWYLTSDFVAIDEMGKERFRDGDTFFRTELERLLKGRYEDRMPCLLATNASLGELERYYGATLSSMLTGKYERVMMEPGDFRKEKRKKMKRDMSRGR